MSSVELVEQSEMSVNVILYRMPRLKPRRAFNLVSFYGFISNILLKKARCLPLTR